MLKSITEEKTVPFIVTMEEDILHQMRKNSPHKTFIPAPLEEHTDCAGECSYMMLNTLKKPYQCLLEESPSIEVEEEIRLNSLRPIHRMLELGK